MTAMLDSQGVDPTCGHFPTEKLERACDICSRAQRNHPDIPRRRKGIAKLNVPHILRRAFKVGADHITPDSVDDFSHGWKGLDGGNFCHAAFMPKLLNSRKLKKRQLSK